MMVRLGIINTYLAPLIVYTGTMVPYMTFFLVGFFSQLPRETLEAGQIDGCSHTGLLWRIVVPLAAPALAAMAIVNFLWAWNELLISLVLLQRDQLRTLAVGLTVFQDRFSINAPATAAGLVIAIIPTMTLYLVGQRYFVRGLTMGGVKE
jgi:ABC-type glycerol-3-phosphate transport system permease component